jgi:hypothetical protein
MSQILFFISVQNLFDYGHHKLSNNPDSFSYHCNRMRSRSGQGRSASSTSLNKAGRNVHLTGEIAKTLTRGPVNYLRFLPGWKKWMSLQANP